MDCGGSVASNEDNAIELTLYRKNGVRPSSQTPNPDLGVQVELGDVPPVTREVISTGQKSIYITVANLLIQEKQVITFINIYIYSRTAVCSCFRCL